MKKIISIIMTVVLFITTMKTVPNVLAKESLGKISINDEFADNRVLVIMDNDTSLKFKTYAANDFSAIDCENVIDLSKNAGNKVSRAMKNIEQHVTQGEKLEKYDGVALGDYKQILCINLKEAGKENVIKAITKISSMEGVYLACPDYKIKAYTYTFNPNDDNSMDYGYNNNIDYLELIGLYDAWNITTGSKNVTVAIMDGGIDYAHDDLSMNFETTEISGTFKNGTYTKGPTRDDDGHGTKVAGIIGAKGNNNKGIAGVCWNINLVSLKILDRYGDGYSYHALMAFNHLLNPNYDVDIVNMSCGWYPANSDGTPNTYYDAVFNTAISNYGKLVVCAAGNEGKNLDTNLSYPTSYSCANVITVGASNETDNIWQEPDDDNVSKMSNYGEKSVDLFAPGYRILSTYPTAICDNAAIHKSYRCISYGYHVDSGTSLAAPFVTGVAALMLSINPNLPTHIVKDIILRSVDRIPSLQNYCVTGGRLNAFKAVQTASNLRFDYDYTYNAIDAYSHGVICDTCECTCRMPDYSCNNCDFCDNCDECHIYYTELHYWYYQIIQGNPYYHRAVCSFCGYQTSDEHDWVSSGMAYVCTVCNMTATSIPGIMQTPSDDELLLASIDDDHGVGDALLPEREDDLVTE